MEDNSSPKTILDKLGMPPFMVTHHKCVDGEIKKYPALLCSKCMGRGIDLCLSK